MALDFITSDKKGFTINMAHYVKRAKEVRDGFIINGNSWLRIYVNSDYNLGYFFGCFLSRGIANLSNYRGQVVFRMYDDEDATKLYESVEDAFNLAARFRVLSPERYETIIYSKPLAVLLREFGMGESRSLPEKYLVNNSDYLRGIKDGIHDLRGFEEDDRETLKKRTFSRHVKEIYDGID